jgi:hypothetical protein
MRPIIPDSNTQHLVSEIKQIISLNSDKNTKQVNISSN